MSLSIESIHNTSIPPKLPVIKTYNTHKTKMQSQVYLCILCQPLKANFLWVEVENEK